MAVGGRGGSHPARLVYNVDRPKQNTTLIGRDFVSVLALTHEFVF